MDMERGLVMASAVARAIGRSERTVHRMARSGALPCIRRGRSVRFDPRIVAGVLAARTTDNKEEQA
jgi:hypothetical protein